MSFYSNPDAMLRSPKTSPLSRIWIILHKCWEGLQKLSCQPGCLHSFDFLDHHKPVSAFPLFKDTHNEIKSMIHPKVSITGNKHSKRIRIEPKHLRTLYYNPRIVFIYIIDIRQSSSLLISNVPDFYNQEWFKIHIHKHTFERL